MITKELIQEIAKKYKNIIKEIREHIHMYPELSFEEYKTKEYICYLLEKNNIEYIKDIGNVNSVICIIKGKKNGKKIGIRVELDALPINEELEVSYRSRHPGKMHACGHDLHIAVLLGAMFILNEIRDKFNGEIYGIFQPAEEKAPGGAICIINDNYFKKINFDYIISYHSDPNITVGKIGLHYGPFLASSDEIKITINGKGGHAAHPHLTIDPIIPAINSIISIYNYLYKKTNLEYPYYVSFGKLLANGTYNVIPNKIEIEGTLRTFNEIDRNKILKKIKEIFECNAQAFDCIAQIEINNGYPVLLNDFELYKKIKKISIEYLGNDNVIDVDKKLASDDFAHYSQKYKTFTFRLGTGGSYQSSFPLHSPFFDINESIYDFAHSFLSFLLLKLLHYHE